VSHRCPASSSYLIGVYSCDSLPWLWPCHVSLFALSWPLEWSHQPLGPYPPSRCSICSSESSPGL
jgi:hypothetical protein